MVTARIPAAAILALAFLSGCTLVRPAADAPPDAAPGTVTVNGYRIQVHTSGDKREADAEAERASAWWAERSRAERAALGAPADIEVEVQWLQPYYRVRLGHVPTREAATPLLEALRADFPSAFLIPESYSVQR